MNKRQTLLIAILAIIALGCTVPRFFAVTAAPPPVPTPTTDNRLPTLVAEKVLSAMTQTAQALPPTPTFTSTPEPPTPTSTPTATQPVGSVITAQEDTSLLFIDERAGYEIVIPEGWMIVRVGQQEFLDALSAVELDAPLLYEALKKIENEDPHVLRLFAADTKDETAEGEPITTIKLILDETRGMSFNSEQDLQAIADDLQKTTQGLEVTSLDILTSPNDMQFGAIESETKAADGMLTYDKRVYFKARTGVVYAWLTTGESLKQTIIPAFDAIMDTIKPTAQ